MAQLDLQTLVVTHGWVLGAFTVLVATLARMTRRPASLYWLYSDAAGIFALLGIYLVLTRGDDTSLTLFAFSTYCMLSLRIIALSPMAIKTIFQRIALIALIPLVVFNIFLDPVVLAIKLTINFIVFLILSACLIYVGAWANRTDNQIGRGLIGLSCLAYMAIAIIRAATLFDYDSTNIVNTTAFSALTLTMLMVSGIFGHIGFIIITLDQMSRSEWTAEQALLREAERRADAEMREQESLAKADEMKRLIDVLTHEVRQPLNNASAALQSIGAELSGQVSQTQNIAVRRAQTVIDEVGMALSNALVAATILERQKKFNPVRYDPALLVDMVIMDFSDEDRSRIRLDTETAPLYVTADPVLLRIGLRNLLDNALRYSPDHSKIDLRLIENEEDIGAEFQIVNDEPSTIDFSQTDIFARRVRGRSTQPEGSGLGLYITSEIAKLHQGWVRTHEADGRRTFSLFIQD